MRITSAGKVGIGTASPSSVTGENNILDISGSMYPTTDNVFNLGSSIKRWSNIYSADLQLSNEGTEGNEVDGTTGNWTLQEGKDDIFIINRETGKKYKFALEEIE